MHKTHKGYTGMYKTHNGYTGMYKTHNGYTGMYKTHNGYTGMYKTHNGYTGMYKTHNGYIPVCTKLVVNAMTCLFSGQFDMGRPLPGLYMTARLDLCLTST